jgi:phenylalanyl-tRNA synthetase beta chain
MRVSYEWLRQYCDPPGSPEALGELLRQVGIGVEGYEALVSGDTCLVTEITPNRSDWLGMLGVAREVATVTRGPLREPTPLPKEAGTPVQELCAVEVIDRKLCPRYTARVITGVTVGPSPDWLRRRLESVGLRAVNNVVDVTNFVMWEYAQPLHAFDGDRLEGRRIVVRPARAGERITAIDGSVHDLKPHHLVIADARRPVAIAGVMGGLDTEVTERTRTVLLESAEFDPLSVRQTTRELALPSESSYRFERGVDPAGVARASQRAAALIAEVAGGTVAAGVVDRNYQPKGSPRVSLRYARIARILGIEVAAEEVLGILTALGFKAARRSGRQVTVVVPTWRRRDVTREIDLIEEVARIVGYERMPTAERVEVRMVRPGRLDTVCADVRGLLVGAGFFETVNLSLLPEWAASVLSPWCRADPIAVRNPLSAEYAYLRRSLLPSLLRTQGANERVRQRDLQLFELAPVYWPDPASRTGCREQRHLALLATRGLLEVKGLVEEVLARLGIQADWREGAMPGFAPGRFLELWLKGERLGVLGEVASEEVRRFDLRQAPVVAELRLEELATEAELVRRFQPLARYPEVERELAVVVDEAVRWADVQRVIQGLAIDILEGFGPPEAPYRGAQVGQGRKSLTFPLTFRSPVRTLSSEEVAEAVGRIVGALAGELGAQLRVEGTETEA